MKKSITDWLQAISSLTIALVTVWLVFFSGVGELAMQLLRSELWSAREEIEQIHEEKDLLATQTDALQAERDELAQQREENLRQVVNARLGDLWDYGVRILRAHRSVAEIAQSLPTMAEKIEPFRNWDEGDGEPFLDEPWFFDLPVADSIPSEKRTDWGEVLQDWSGAWKCSKDRKYAYDAINEIKFDAQETEPHSEQRLKLLNEWQQEVAVEYPPALG